MPKLIAQTYSLTDRLAALHRMILGARYGTDLWRLERAPGRLSDPDWAIMRRIVWARERGRCCNCGADEGRRDVHHIVPIAQGGTNRLTNLTVICRACHRSVHPWL